MKRRPATWTCELGLKTPQVWPQKKRRKKDLSISGFCSLPDEIAMMCLTQASRFDHAALAIASKSHRCLVSLPELCRLRKLMGCTEASLYVSLRILPEPKPSWFILTPNRRLSPLPSSPCQSPKGSSFVVVDWGIFVIGGIINGNPTSDVSFFDCFSHTWGLLPSMNVARASASASFIDGNIYVFGGCGVSVDSLEWAEKFDIRSRTWVRVKYVSESHMYLEIQQSVVMVEAKKNIVYAVDDQGRNLNFSPTENTPWKFGQRDSNHGNKTDWCAIGELLYCRGIGGRILWCDPDEFVWKEVKFLEELQNYLSGSRQILNGFDEIRKRKVKYDINKLCTNSAGNIVIFWNSQLEDPECLELRSAEISLERREGGEVWGKIEWSGSVFNLDPHSPSYSINVLYSASVYV